MNQPFLDLAALHQGIQPELDAAYQRVIASQYFILGPELDAFENEYAAANEVRHCIGVGNGYDALVLMMKAYGIGPGDEVIVPAHTFVATWLAVSRCGAKIVPVEPSIETYNIDPLHIEAAITTKTVAILPVHLYGQPAEMLAINQIAEKYGLLVLADAAQSHGAVYMNKAVATFSHAVATSFYPGKNLGALGDGGAVLTNDTQIAEKIRKLRNYGSTTKYYHEAIGYNSRLDEFQAAFLRVKLNKLDDWNQLRAKQAKHYCDKFAGADVIAPVTIEQVQSAWHLYVIQVPNRARLQKILMERGIVTLIHYPVPPYRQTCYAENVWPSLPITDILAETVLSLPLYPGLSQTDIERIADAVIDVTAALLSDTVP